MLQSRRVLELLFIVSGAASPLGCECGSVSGLDAGMIDAHRERPDAFAEEAVAPDAGSLPARDPMRCRVEPDDVYLLGTDDAVTSPERVIDVAAGEGEFGAVWWESSEGFAQVRLARIPSLAGAPSEVAITEGAAVHEEPAVAAISGGYLVLWTDNTTGDFEVSARPVLASSPGALVRITTRTGRDASAALVSVDGGILAAWVETREAEPARVAVTRSLAPSGEPRGAAHEPITSANLGRVVLGPRAGGVAMLYGEGGAMPSVLLQRASADGSAVGTAARMSSEGDAAGDVDIGMTERDGAAVFTAVLEGVRRDVRVRLLDGAGTPAMSEFALNDGTEQGDSASVARLRDSTGWSEGCRDGYAVVYRSYASASAPPVLRLVLLDAGAHVVRAVDLSPTDISSRGGRTTLRIAGDGSLLVAWTDAHGDRVDMRAARIRCD